MAVCVNLSVSQFMQKNLPLCVADALAQAGLPARFLELEITEAIIMNGADATIATLDSLRQLGVRLTIDDFGTGYSSLNFLHRFPIDKLKIDSSFMDGIGMPAEDAAVITAIIALAKSLKLTVLAEGVETEEQLRFLRASGCDQYQGYMAGAPAAMLRLGTSAELSGGPSAN